jgi:hypothetical protein
MSDGWVATQNGECPRIAMFPVSAPGSLAWQPDPTSRLLRGIVTPRKYGHLVRAGFAPGIPTALMITEEKHVMRVLFFRDHGRRGPYFISGR